MKIKLLSKQMENSEALWSEKSKKDLDEYKEEYELAIKKKQNKHQEEMESQKNKFSSELSSEKNKHEEEMDEFE